MTLTVPRAGIDAGRAANMAAMPVPQDPRAEALAKLGDIASQNGARIQAESDEIALQRINLDMARDLGRARQEADQINDPVAVDQFWAKRSAEIKDTYSKMVPALNQPLAQRVGLVFDEMNNRHVMGVAQRAIDLNSSQRAAMLIEQSGAIAAAAATAPPETVEQMLAMGENLINMRLESGDITPEQAAAERAKFRSNVLHTRARSEIAQDPDAWLANNEAYKELGTAYADLIISAKTASALRIEKATKEAEIAAKERQTQIGVGLKDIAETISQGGIHKDEHLLNLDEVKNHPAYPEAAAKIALAREGKFMAQMTPAQFEAAIAEEKAQPKGHAYEMERLKVLTETYTEMKTAWANDAVAAAKTAGLSVPELPAFDPNNPDTFAQGLAKRLNFDAGVREVGYISNSQAIISKEDQAALSAIMAPTADAAPKVALLKSVLTAQANTRAPADQINGLLATIGGDDVTARGLRLLRDTGDTSLVEKMLRGQQQVKLDIIALPPENQRKLIFAEATGGIFNDNPRLAAQHMAAASALYAADAAGVNPDGDNSIIPFASDTEAQDSFRRAIAQVTGVATDRNGDPVIGGLQDVNGAKVILPVGVHRSEVEDALESATYQLRGMQFNAVAGRWIYENAFAGVAPDTEAAKEQLFDGVPFEGSAEQALQKQGELTRNPQPAPKRGGWEMLGAVNATVKPALDPYRAFRAASTRPGAAPVLGKNPSAAMQDIQFQQVLDGVDEYRLLRRGADGRLYEILDENGLEFRMTLNGFLAGARQ